MTHSLYLLGAPGVGKSTALDGWIAARGLTAFPDPIALGGLLRGHSLDDAGGVMRALYLGVRRVTFSGTDALGMAVAPDARRWASEKAEAVRVPIVGEGARLGNVGFLTALGAATNLTLILLTARDARLEQRRQERGSTQSLSWMRGAATGARNAYAGAIASGVVTTFAEIDTSELTPDEVVKRVVALA